jgi:DNA invertase Pin-like site-specific DNA recombinase
MSLDKIRPEHLARPAFVYVRQSSRDQVLHHKESQRRQYGLRDRAQQLGWQEVTVIDDDLGRSGASTAGRVGFQRLVATVSLGQAGAVFSIEVSRFARNNRDWYQLMDLCAMMNTLIVDDEGIYDTRLPNDRLLLGLKGTMSEAELGWLRQRAHAALVAKAKRGELILGVPVGYVRDADDRIERHPDQRVRQAVALVFQKFAELSSVRQVLLWFRQENIELPTMAPGASACGTELVWRLPVYNTIHGMLTNPSYAGAYVFGRTTTRTRVVDGAVRKTPGHEQPPESWTALLRGHHEGYIEWATYERNRRRIADNAQMKGVMVRGAVRDGKGLLAGLLRCGHCGRRLHVAYGGKRGVVPRYHCRGALVNHGEAGCISFGGLRVDQAVEREVLAVLQPAAIEAALTTVAQRNEEREQRRRALDLELREAEYEAGRAQRQYDTVEPENRLVAETLERRWNETLAQVAEVRRRLQVVESEAAAEPEPDRNELLALAQSFPVVWHAPATDERTKKRLVRLLIAEIIARVTAAPTIDLVIHWKGGKHTQLQVIKNRTGEHSRCTDREVIDVVRDLARQMPDAQIARVLNRLGYRSGAGNTFTEPRVRSLRADHRILVYKPSADDSHLTMARAAAQVGVSAATIRRWIRDGILPAHQSVMHAPWTIARQDLHSEAVQRAVKAGKAGRKLPRTAPAGQLPLIKSGT